MTNKEHLKQDEYKKGGEQIRECQICGLQKPCMQHHLERGFGRSSSKVIWLCFKCHRKIHDDPEWAYEEGYQVKHDYSFKGVQLKTKKDKTCKHTKSYYDKNLGYVKCQFCGKQII